MTPSTLLALLAIAVVVALSLFVQNLSLRRDIARRVEDEVARWRDRDMDRARTALERQVRDEAALAMERWKTAHTAELRKDAIQRSQAVTAGKVAEQLVPYLPGFLFNPRDARFLGSPVDLIVFDGMDEGDLSEVVFIEVKTGGAGLSKRERRLRDTIRAGRVSWVELRLPRES